MKSFFVGISIFFLSLNLQADWPTFRGPQGNGFSPSESPAILSADGAKSWKTSLPGRGLSSPIVMEDKIFLTASSGSEQRNLHVLAFDSSDGQRLWERKFKATGRTICHEKTCVAASTMASDGRVLISQFSSNDVFCLDLSGNLRWLRGLTYDHPNLANGLGMSSSPLIVGGAAIIQVENDADSFSFALSLSDGSTLWKKERPRGANWTSPIVMGSKGREIVGLQSKEGLVAVEPSSGKNLWSYTDGAATIPSSAWSEERIVLIPSNGITALQLDETLRRFDFLWRENKLKPGTGSPAVRDGKLFVVNNANVLSCASVKTGEIDWRLRIKGPVSSSPVIGGNHLYLFSETGLCQIIDLSEKSPQIVHSIELDETILCTPAVNPEGIFVRSDHALFKLSD